MSSKKDKISRLLAESLDSSDARKEGARVNNVLSRFLGGTEAEKSPATEASLDPQTSLVGQASPATETSPENLASHASEASPAKETSLANEASLVNLTTPAKETSLANLTSLDILAGPAGQASPAAEASLAKYDDLAMSVAGQANLTSPASTADPPEILRNLPATAGYLRLPLQVVDHLLTRLDPHESLIYLHLYRLQYGFKNKFSVFIKVSTLAARTNISERSVSRALDKLINLGLVQKLSYNFGKGKEQGIDYRVVAPASPARETSLASGASPDSVADMNITTNKKQHTQTQVGVGSRFSLEECRQYAEHLKATGQGISNPGGYATTIYRTGEADELIAGWLQSREVKQVDMSQCPDCQGLGFRYPNGIEGGVVKCKHEKLRPQSTQAKEGQG